MMSWARVFQLWDEIVSEDKRTNKTPVEKIEKKWDAKNCSPKKMVR
jgi:hypothetical protein